MGERTQRSCQIFNFSLRCSQASERSQQHRVSCVSKHSKLATCLASQWVSAVQLWGLHCRVLIRGSSWHLRFCRVPCISFRQIVLLSWGKGYCFEGEKNNFHSWTPHSSLHLLRCHLPVPPEVIPFVKTGWTRRRKWWHSVTNDISFWWGIAVIGRLLSVEWFRTCEQIMFRFGCFTASRLVLSAHFEIHICHSLRVEHYFHRTVHPHIHCRTSVLG